MRTIADTYSSLKKKLETGYWPSGTRLPSLAELARLHSVSRTTMWRAVGLLQKDMLLHAKQRGAIIAGPGGVSRSEHNGESAHGYLWERLKERIGRDIQSGAFSEPMLPLSSKLARQYGVTLATIRKSLHMLVSENFLTSEGRRYRQVRGGLRRFRPNIVLITAGGKTSSISTTDFRTLSLVESFERECSKFGHASRCEGFDDTDPNSLLKMKSILAEQNEVSGFVLNIWNPWDATHWQRWCDLLAYLTELKLPVIVVDQAANLQFPVHLVRSPFIRVLRIALERPGEMVAEVLLRGGHRQIAYITPYPDQDWAMARYHGLARYMKRYAKPRCNVELFEFTENIDYHLLIIALLDLDKEGVRALYREGTSKERMNDLLARIDRISNLKLKDRWLKDGYSKTLQPLVRTMMQTTPGDIDPQARFAVQSALQFIAGEHALSLYLKPYFRTVLEKSRSTAWVCSDDKTALAALAFLEEKKKKVPEEISVIGFDNWRQAYDAQLSTFDFNMDGMVRQALLMIVDKKSFKNRPVISEVDGYVVERKTTRG